MYFFVDDYIMQISIFFATYQTKPQEQETDFSPLLLAVND
jgi:hypothetical protein